MTERNTCLAASIIIATLFLTTACTVSEVITAEHTDLEVARQEIAENLLLDIGVINFSEGIPRNNDPEKSGVFEEIRRAEARYLPYHIKTTLQGTGYWGAVRVVPSRYVFTDVTLTGEIERSDGEYIELRVNVEDATGRHWFERRYEMRIFNVSARFPRCSSLLTWRRILTATTSRLMNRVRLPCSVCQRTMTRWLTGYGRFANVTVWSSTH